MAKVDLMQFAAAETPEGETAISAVKVNWNGMVPPTPLATGGIAGLGRGEFAPELEGPPADAVIAPADPDAMVTFPSARQMVLVLTEHRLLVWSLGFSGKPKDYIGDVPLTAITAVDLGGGGFGDIVRISMASTAKVDLEIMRGEPAEDFVAALSGRISPSETWTGDFPTGQQPTGE